MTTHSLTPALPNNPQGTAALFQCAAERSATSSLKASGNDDSIPRRLIPLVGRAAGVKLLESPLDNPPSI
ncbi:hypothetical protein Nepgr_028910 [Nepenthes gracilis]|uniref:Uncharacterized protein n=1 Tax=Nepenthes gracilis TaxID=150966 RepID=A0AAD3TCY2_NEPGR|nr:hypothetical protein Nepgr_028910 [Nepenthes gracilis]